MEATHVRLHRVTVTIQPFTDGTAELGAILRVYIEDVPSNPVPNGLATWLAKNAIWTRSGVERNKLLNIIAFVAVTPA